MTDRSLSDDWDSFAPAPPGTHPPLDTRRTARRRSVTPPGPRALDPGKADPPSSPARCSARRVDAGRRRPDDRPDGEAVGQRIIVTGRLLDAGGRPIPSSLVEIWQANAPAATATVNDQWPGTLDPNFTGGGRGLTDADGRYRFTTIRPGAYPWGNHPNAWRPAHIHFSVFGRSFTAAARHPDVLPRRPAVLPGPDLQLGPRPGARQRLVARYDHDVTRGSGRSASASTSCCAARQRTPFEEPMGGSTPG